MGKWVFVMFLFSCFMARAQQIVSWKDLENVRFVQIDDKDAPFGFARPIFGSNIKQLNGKEIVITGYYLDLGGNFSTKMLSKNPMASCFFCGVGGPESIIEIQFEKRETFKTDDLVTVSGIFELNEDNPTGSIYTIKKADGMIIR